MFSFFPTRTCPQWYDIPHSYGKTEGKGVGKKSPATKWRQRRGQNPPPVCLFINLLLICMLFLLIYKYYI